MRNLDELRRRSRRDPSDSVVRELLAHKEVRSGARQKFEVMALSIWLAEKVHAPQKGPKPLCGANLGTYGLQFPIKFKDQVTCEECRGMI